MISNNGKIINITSHTGNYYDNPKGKLIEKSHTPYLLNMRCRYVLYINDIEIMSFSEHDKFNKKNT